MKVMKYAALLAASLTIILMGLTACDNFFHELIPPDDPRISEFELNRHNANIYEDSIEIAWYAGMAVDRQFITGLAILDKASLLPLTGEYISAAFPGSANHSGIIESLKERPASLKSFVERDSGFNVPSLDIPLDLSSPVSLLVISGRGTIKHYTLIIIVNVEFDADGGAPAPASLTRHYGDSVDEPPPMTKTGCAFDKWYTDSACTVPAVFPIAANGNIALFAKWLEAYTVAFESNGGGDISPNPVMVLHGETVPRPQPAPFKTGYTFGGWYADNGAFKNEWDFENDAVTDDITLYAEWNPIMYYVAYHANDGTGTPMPDSAHLYDEEKALSKNAYTFDGYRFMGWSRAANGTAEYADGESVENLAAIAEYVVTLYAQWKKLYNVAFDENGGSLVPPQIVPDGEKAELPNPDPEKPGSILNGWYTEAGDKWDFEHDTVTADITLRAQWSLIPYTITFNADGGSPAPESLTRYYDDTVAKPSEMTKTGYTFGGWYTDNGTFKNGWDFENDAVTDDVTLYAEWNPITYYVAYHANGGDGPPMPNSTHIYDKEQPLTPYGFTRTGYVFGGWNNPYDPANSPYPDGKIVTNLAETEGDVVTLYAQWKKLYNVAFDENGGSLVPPQIVPDGEKAELPNPDPEKPGSIFDGWFEKKDGIISSIKWDFGINTVTADTFLIAKWLTAYTVTFDAQGDSPVPPKQTVADGGKAAKPSDPSRTNYTFLGWDRNQDPEAELIDPWVFENDTVTANITLYAKWEINKYTVTFNSNEGSNVAPIPDVPHGNTISEPTDPPTRANYRFDGWYKPGLTVKWKFNGDEPADTVTANITLYAKWIPDPTAPPATYTITFNANGGSGTVPDSIKVDAGSSTYLPAGNNLSMPNHVFDGWNIPNGTKPNHYPGDLYTPPGDIELFAQWQINQYTVTFNSNGGSSVPSQDVDYGGYASKPADPTRTGYTFDGWYKEFGLVNKWEFASDIVIANTTLYAKWLADQYFILSFEDIVDHGPVLSGVTIHRASYNGQTRATITVRDPNQYDSIKWYYNGEHLGTGASLELNTNLPDNHDHYNLYNMVGPKFLTVEVKKGGIPYNTTITFTVAE